ncbi:hypothetical protein FF38_03408 [Lucilia cuprina]|uniref:UNC93-like protein MFSD11 n=1 Tax=Lucilia cuprina TaxID=7375 RepID=A0A0L0C0S7_LUCCU|nr:UNC93-like protein MFSD11 [Lucilia cuprina]KAI8130345.1 UNC93-like protein MFSD11 [Lucilia cuprina]KNC25900.1 hypothetical protein FF38_03408 [Lucilia cuprina]
MDIKFVNVLILGFGFMFVFTSFQTMGNIEKTLLVSINKDDPSFKGDGYISLAVIYASFALCNWFAPSFIAFTGPRTAMLVGALTYTFFMVTFLFPTTWLLYVSSALLGAGAAITWTGQGTFLARCSDSGNISRNSGIFWALLQCSMFFGNLFVYYQFQNKDHIDEQTRSLVIGVLIAVAVLGVIFLATLRSVPDNSHMDTELQHPQSPYDRSKVALVSAGKLFLTRDMLMLSMAFLYTGFELSFFSGVYGPSIGFTQKISDTPKEIMGLAGICIGVGEVFGGSLFGILASKTTRFGRDPIVIVGYVIHMIAFLLIFLNLPDAAPFNDTDDMSYFDPPQVWIALVCALMLGFGDACFNTQIYSMLGGVFVKNSVGAFALFKFTQSVAAAISFFYSSHLGLRAQLGILVVTGTIGAACFCIVEWRAKRRAREESQDVSEVSESISDYHK